MCSTNSNIWLLMGPLAIVLSLASETTAGVSLEQMNQWLGDSSINQVRPWNDLNANNCTVFIADQTVLFSVDKIRAVKEIEFPKLNNVAKAIYWLNDPDRNSLRISQTASRWKIHLTPVPKTANPVVVLETSEAPMLPKTSLLNHQKQTGVITLPAHHAVVHGKTLQFEPQPHKNTIGVWIDSDDWTHWIFNVTQPGKFDVHVLQGCGTGQGGSEVDILVNGQQIRFAVDETGHFQRFKPRMIGTIRLTEGDHRLEVRPVALANHAVMDLRQIKLVPARINSKRRQKRPDRPNVVILLTDDQGTLDAGCYGARDLFTPYMDGLAASGVRFTQAYCHTVCCPTRAMLLTGRHPQRSGVNSWTQGDANGPFKVNMHSDEITLAEVLHDAGYATCLSGKWHLGAAHTHGPTTQGFDRFFGIRGGFIDNYNHFYLHGQGFHDLYFGNVAIYRTGEYFPDMVTEVAIDFIQRNANQPFMLYAAMNTPHYPEQADNQFDQYYAAHKMPRKSYGKMISTTDERIGRILRQLDKQGLAENTIVVFMSDNGHSAEDFQIRTTDHRSGYTQGHDYGALGGGGNTGKWRGHKGTFFEGGIRVPAIVSFPSRIPAGIVRDQPVTAADWFPTILDLCAVKAPNVKLDGRSLLPIIENNAQTHHATMHWQWQTSWAVRRDSWKLIREHSGRQLLVSLAEEPPERTNFATQKPGLVQELSLLHEAWKTEMTEITACQ